MNDIDDKIRKALEIDQEMLKKAQAVDDPGFFEMLIQFYRGKNRWLGYMAFIDILFFFCIGTWALYEFFQTDSIQIKLGWSLLFLGSLIVVAMGKLWTWMQINKNTMMREMKRVELQLLRLQEGLKSR